MNQSYSEQELKEVTEKNIVRNHNECGPDDSSVDHEEKNSHDESEDVNQDSRDENSQIFPQIINVNDEEEEKEENAVLSYYKQLCELSETDNLKKVLKDYEPHFIELYGEPLIGFIKNGFEEPSFTLNEKSIDFPRPDPSKEEVSMVLSLAIEKWGVDNLEINGPPHFMKLAAKIMLEQKLPLKCENINEYAKTLIQERDTFDRESMKMDQQAGSQGLAALSNRFSSGRMGGNYNPGYRKMPRP